MCGEEGLRKGRTALPGQGGCVGSRSPPSTRLPPPAPSPQQFLPLTVMSFFCNKASGIILSGLCPVCGSGMGWRGTVSPG